MHRYPYKHRGLDIPEMSEAGWWEAARNYSSPLETEVETSVYDQPPTQRVFGNPVYDNDGNLRCRACGGVLARSTSRFGEGLATCSDTGCKAHGLEFVEGSFRSNPARR